MNCEHEFEYEKDWKKKIQFNSIYKGTTIEIPEVCGKCGLKANEVWAFSCHTDRQTGEEV